MINWPKSLTLCSPKSSSTCTKIFLLLQYIPLKPIVLRYWVQQILVPQSWLIGSWRLSERTTLHCILCSIQDRTASKECWIKIEVETITYILNPECESVCEFTVPNWFSTAARSVFHINTSS